MIRFAAAPSAVRRWLCRLPAGVAVAAAVLLVLHGPIGQLADYHRFADRSVLLGVPHAGDVLSSAGFAIVGLWGWRVLAPMREHPAIRDGWHGYRLFLAGLMLTTAGSAFYHLAPDNARLVWDRLPIALACAGLLAAVRAEVRAGADALRDSLLFAGFAAFGVAWWYVTDRYGQDDLRPYLLLQALLLLIPLWQAIHGSPRADRVWFAAALLLYVVAKVAELLDHALLALLGWASGHTLKHLLATAAAAVLVARLRQRLREYAAATHDRDTARVEARTGEPIAG